MQQVQKLELQFLNFSPISYAFHNKVMKTQLPIVLHVHYICSLVATWFFFYRYNFSKKFYSVQFKIMNKQLKYKNFRSVLVSKFFRFPSMDLWWENQMWPKASVYEG